MGIRIKLMITILIVALAGAFIGIVAYHSNNTVASSYHVVSNESSPKLFLLSSIANQVNRIQVEAISYVLLKLTNAENEIEHNSAVLSKANEELAEMQEATKKLTQYLNDLKEIKSFNFEQDEKIVYSEIDKVSEAFLLQCSALVSAVDKAEPKSSLAKYKNEIEELEQVVLKIVAEEIDREHAVLNQRMEMATKNASSSSRLILSITALVVMLTIVMGVLLSNSIVKPIVELKEFAFSVGKGNLDQKISIRNQDEIGKLSTSFQQMTNDLKHTLEEKTKLAELAAEAKNEKLRVSELKKRNHELEQFAHVSSHDLKAPLVNIASIITMIEVKGGADEETTFLIDKIKSTVDSMQQKITKFNEVLKLKKNIQLDSTTINFPTIQRRYSRILRCRSTNATQK